MSGGGGLLSFERCSCEEPEAITEWSAGRAAEPGVAERVAAAPELVGLEADTAVASGIEAWSLDEDEAARCVRVLHRRAGGFDARGADRVRAELHRAAIAADAGGPAAEAARHRNTVEVRRRGLRGAAEVERRAVGAGGDAGQEQQRVAQPVYRKPVELGTLERRRRRVDGGGVARLLRGGGDGAKRGHDEEGARRNGVRRTRAGADSGHAGSPARLSSGVVC